MLFAFGRWILGLFDDLYDLSVLFRLLFQFTLCIFCLGLAWSMLPGVPWIGGDWSRLLWVSVGSFWCVWLLNLYNFMDGIDGLAGGEVMIASLFFFLLFAREGESGWAVANLLIAASTMGFLIFNWPPARVFMGDAGSLFLGAFSWSYLLPILSSTRHSRCFDECSAGRNATRLIEHMYIRG